MSGSSVYPLAPSQETIWELMRFIAPDAVGSVGVNASGEVWLRGSLDDDLLRAAVVQVAARHDALRIRFVDLAAQPTFRILDAVPCPLFSVDLSTLPEAERAVAAARIVAAAHDRPYDLTAWPLWEVRLVRLAADHHVVVVSMCHLIGDGWSAQVLLRDIGAAYGALSGRGPEPAPLQLRYRDVLTTDLARRTSVETTAYWQDRLTPLPSAHPLASHIVDSGADPDYSIRTPFRFTPELPGRLAETAARWRTTPFITVLGAYRALLGAYTGWDRVILGTTTLGRGRPGSRDLVGQFTTNTYVAITVRPDATLRETVDATHTEMLAATRYATSFQGIARAVNRGFDRCRPWPFLHLYDAWFQSDIPVRPPRFPGLMVEAAPPVPVEDAPPPRAAPRLTAVDPATQAAAVKRQTPWILLDPDCGGGAVEYGPAYFTAEFAAGWPQLLDLVAATVINDPGRRIRDLYLPEPAAAGHTKE